MLVAVLDDAKIPASSAVRGSKYCCPGCRAELTLRQGRSVVHHFAHKASSACLWSSFETRAHMEAKQLIADALMKPGIRCEIECVVETLCGDRRADVMVWAPNGRMIAIELQHTPISLAEIERCAFSYAQAGIAKVWVPFVGPNVWKEGKRKNDDWFVPQYPARDFERWVHGFNIKSGMWMYDDGTKTFWLARLDDRKIFKEEHTWHSEDGHENTSGGYWTNSKKHRELTLQGPHKIEDLLITVKPRQAFSVGGYNWLACKSPVSACCGRELDPRPASTLVLRVQTACAAGLIPTLIYENPGGSGGC